MKALAQFVTGMDFLLNLIIFKLRKTRIQKLLKEIEDFLRTSNDNEKTILQKYTDRYTIFFILVAICHCLGFFAFCCGPIFLSTKWPIEIWYPFSIESPMAICIFYILQVYVIMKAGLNFIVILMFGMFFLYSSAKLEMLCSKIQSAKNKSQINSCIKKHQKIIKYVNEASHAVQYILYKTNIVMSLVIISSTCSIIRGRSLWVSYQFVFMIICGCQKLYLTAWTADDLMENSVQVAMEIYSIPWFENLQYNTKDICFMIQRSQMPLGVNIRGLLPTLSLEYFTKYSMTTISYLTTMKTIIGD
ncbi:odorant receptor 4-like [Cataglyphis hispanica]|uniref:odorant receptor 4-like n=1 Tax=Cataglyphis hispanica TaxID=1086592 RepID=UPI00218056A7|nr:odorant receptor 4-like [Cataglyphis hispanica]